MAVLIVAFGAFTRCSRSLSCFRARPRTGLGPTDLGEFGGWLLGGFAVRAGRGHRSQRDFPTWEQIGQLAAIAAIRTFLSYFLERDLMEIYAATDGRKRSRRLTLQNL